MQKYISGCFAALVHNIQADGRWKWRDECLCVCLDWKKCIKHEDISIKMWLGHSPDVSVLNSFFCSLNFPTRDRLIESGPLCERVCISLLDHLPPWRRLCYPFLPPPPTYSSSFEVVEMTVPSGELRSHVWKESTMSGQAVGRRRKRERSGNSVERVEGR